jgi:hypothetical protein
VRLARLELHADQPVDGRALAHGKYMNHVDIK